MESPLVVDSPDVDVVATEEEELVPESDVPELELIIKVIKTIIF